MTQISLAAAEAALGVLSGQFQLSVGSSPPGWTPGLWWYNTSVNALYGWNATQWVSLAQRYLALLYTDPATSGAGGGPAVYISDLTECQDAGYTRQLCAFSPAAPLTTGVPVQVSNTSAVTVGPFTVDMTGAASWVALVSCPSGVNGMLLYTWNVPSDQTQQVGASQSITYPAGTVVLDQS
jgi:hypothetical protein